MNEGEVIGSIVREKKYELYAKAACATIYLCRSVLGIKNMSLNTPKELYHILFNYLKKCDNTVLNTFNGQNDKETLQAINNLRISGIDEVSLKKARIVAANYLNKFYNEDGDNNFDGKEFTQCIGSHTSSFKQAEKEVAMEMLGMSKTTAAEFGGRTISIILPLMDDYIRYTRAKSLNPEVKPELSDLQDTNPVREADYESELEDILKKCQEAHSSVEAENVGLNPKDVNHYLYYTKNISRFALTNKEEDEMTKDLFEKRAETFRLKLLKQYIKLKGESMKLSEGMLRSLVSETVKGMIKSLMNEEIQWDSMTKNHMIDAVNYYKKRKQEGASDDDIQDELYDDEKFGGNAPCIEIEEILEFIKNGEKFPKFNEPMDNEPNEEPAENEGYTPSEKVLNYMQKLHIDTTHFDGKVEALNAIDEYGTKLFGNVSPEKKEQLRKFCNGLKELVKKDF